MKHNLKDTREILTKLFTNKQASIEDTRDNLPSLEVGKKGFSSHPSGQHENNYN